MAIVSALFWDFDRPPFHFLASGRNGYIFWLAILIATSILMYLIVSISARFHLDAATAAISKSEA
jgi:hypothetical protein